jgi:peptide/nickel transport system substrate-binding protein
MFSGTLPLYMYHDALVKIMPEGWYTPCLAESWTISPDYKVYEFKLRKGVKFHNGDEMTAEDVVFSFERFKGLNADFIKTKIQKLEAVNPYLFRLTFKEPFYDFFEYTLPTSSSIAYVLPKKYIQKVGDEAYKKAPVGCGPYKFVEFKPGVRIVGEAFEGFWRKVPNIKRLEYYMVIAPETRYAMIKKGEVDYATRMADTFYDTVKKDPNLRVLTPRVSTNWVVYMTAQWDPKSPWSDVRVRKAASLAIDRKTLADMFFPGAPLSGSLGLPEDQENLPGPPDPYDPERARKLLAEAGYPNGFRAGKFYPQGDAFEQMGDQVANYFKAVGINVETVHLSRPAYEAKTRRGEAKGDLFVESSSQPSVASRLSYLFSYGTKDYIYGIYPEIVPLWNQYNQSFNPKLRKDLITRIQQIMNEKVMFIYMTWGCSPAAVTPKVKGNPDKLQPIICWAAPLEDMEIAD